AASAQPQPPTVLPADIPLDVATIYQPMAPDAEYRDTTRAILAQLQRNHYSTIRLDDTFSSAMLDSYIKALDGARMYFTQADIDEFEQYRNRLDDLLRSGDTDAGFLIYN